MDARSTKESHSKRAAPLALSYRFAQPHRFAQPYRFALRRAQQLAGFGLWVVAAAVGCSGGSLPAKPRASLLEPLKLSGGYVSPGQWHYHPGEHAPMHARAELGGKRTLFAGERGERWLRDRDGEIRAAARVAPETLISILGSSGKRWVFIGASGTTYEAEEPLGDFTRVVSPVEPLVQVSASGSSLVGVLRDGRLVHAAFGADGTSEGWKQAAAKGGQPTDRFVSAKLVGGRAGYALSAPERLWRTQDEGATWQPLTAPRFGGYKLEADGDGDDVIVRGLVDDRRLTGGKLGPFTSRKAKPPVALGKEPPRGPDASALAEARAVLLGARYFELTTVKRDAADWDLVSGELGQPLLVRQTSIPRGCKTVKLAGFDRFLTAACSSLSNDTSHKVTFFQSADAGKSWQELDVSAEGRIHQLMLAVGEGGALLVSGLCPEEGARKGCRPEGVYYLGEKQTDAGEAERAFLPASTPLLKGNALALGYSADGRTAFVAGVRSKSSTFSLYVSTDGGVNFRAEEIEGLSDQLDSGKSWRPVPVQGLRVSSFGAAPDGSLGFVVERGSDTRLLVTDEAGRLLSMASTPAQGVSVGIVGGRALAVSRANEAWESEDAGTEWRSLGSLPAPPCSGRSSCDAAVACGGAGCVVGSVLTRLGWGQDERVLPVLTGQREERRLEVRIRTPLVCNVADEAWRSLEGAVGVPDAEAAAYGKYAWFGAAADADTAAVSFVYGVGGARQRVEREPLFAAAKKPEDVAFDVALQVDGVAAMRFALPKAAAPITDVEFAWHNVQEDKALKGRLPDAGVYRPGDYVGVTGKRAQRASPDLLSIASGGLFVRPHRLARTSQVTYFLDGKSVTELPVGRWPSSGAGGSPRHEIVRVDGRPLPLAVLGHGGGLLLAGDGGEVDAHALGLIEPRLFGAVLSNTITYVGGRAALQLSYHDSGGRNGQTLLFPLSHALNQPPIEAPSQVQLGSLPPRCGSTQRTKTPRVVAPYAPGTRHPVLVNSPSEPPSLLMSAGAVLHGSVKEPCLAALDAEGVATELSDASDQSALILLDDLEHAWLFRVGTQRPSGVGLLSELTTRPSADGRIEYKAMSCSFDSKASLPPEVYAMPGTRVSGN